MRPQKNKILIADDEKNLALLLKKSLMDMDYDVSVAHDGVQAIDMCNIFHPDLLLLDILMPKIDGIGVLKKLRSDPKFSDLKIIVLSAKGQLHQVNEGLEAGADAYLRKPLMFEEILDSIKSHLNDENLIDLSDNNNR